MIAPLEGWYVTTNRRAALLVWGALTVPQRQLLLACVAGCPFHAGRGVARRLAARGLITDDLQPTDAAGWS